ncbi:MAG: site-specific integrase [Bacteroidales bacterium]|nr:site-specific integrase [Bacteroidales bacterium]
MKYSVRFNLQPKQTTDNDGRQYISVRISWAGQRVASLSGEQVPPDYWDNTSQRIKPSYRWNGDTGATINKRLSAITAHFDDYFQRQHLANTVPTTSDIRHELRLYFGTEKQQDEQSIFDLIDIFASTMGEQNGWTHGTFQKFHTIKAHLHDFAPDLQFSDITEDGLQRFTQHLMKKGLRNTTIEKDLGILRWFLRWAHRKGYIDSLAFEEYRPKFKGTDGNSKEIIYLEWNELMRLYEHDFSDRYGLAQVRDVFCFCCFTSLRYSDVAKLRMSDIHGDYISVVTQKTIDGLRIELNDFSRAILERNKDFQQSPLNEGGKALPVISNQKMNAALKEIGKAIELTDPIRIVYYKGSQRVEEVHPKWELLTTHCARRTFVVNALRLGIPAEVIMKWTGHSDFHAMKPYVKIVDELKEQEMTKFNLLSQNHNHTLTKN